MSGAGPDEAAQLVQTGEVHLDRREYALAAPYFRQALELDPEHQGAWHDLGIASKHLGLWEECRLANQRALALRPEDEGAAWNLGIAGTGLSDWPTARQGWSAAKIQLPAGTGPIEMDLGPVAIRVSPKSAPEVVWASRIDPARAILRSVPTPDSGRRWGDLVLHDGAASGRRVFNGRKVPVFDELALLAESRHTTYQLEIEASFPEDVDALDALLGEHDSTAEDWTETVEMLCATCSEGDLATDGHGHHHPPPEWEPRRLVGVASTMAEDELRAVVDRWVGEGRGRRTRLGHWVRRPSRTLNSMERVLPRPSGP